MLDINQFMPGDLLDECHTFKDDFGMKDTFEKYLEES